MPHPILLLYTPSPVPYASKLLSLCAVQGVKLRVLDAAGLDRPLSDLARNAAPAETPPFGEALPEPVLIFCHFSDGQLDRVLASLRKLRFPCLKAVLTPTNARWTLRELYGELCKERSQLGGAHPSPS